MAINAGRRQTEIVSGTGAGQKATIPVNSYLEIRHELKEKQMKKLFTSTLLTVAAVPFLMAAPNAAKKVQNSASTQTQTTKKTKKHHKKASKTATDTAAPSSAPKQ
jgi:hypothetical protein